MKFNEVVDEVLDGNDKRLKRYPWVGIVIHHTGVGGRKEISANLWARLHKNIARYLAKADKVYVSAHFQVGRSGDITQIVDPRKWVSYHAGKSSWWNPIQRKWVNGCNNHFVGIELLGDGNLHEYSDVQMENLVKLCKALMSEFETIEPTCIVGHEMVSPGRKNDPGILFNWKSFFKLLYSN